VIDVNAYLYYGYLPGREVYTSIFRLQQNIAAQCDYTPVEAAYLLDRVVDESLSGVDPPEYYIVPISGGWDSRILLGAALDRFEKWKIRTLTFGVPGQLDYDIGKNVAREFGIEHVAVDLSAVELEWEDLLNSVKISPWTCIPDSYFNHHSIRQAASAKDMVLSGFMGDPLTGGHRYPAETRDEAIMEFVKGECRAKNVRLTEEGYDPLGALPPLPNNCSIPVGELLDLGVRQARRIAPIVTPLKSWTKWGAAMGTLTNIGAQVVAPFAHPLWAAYWIKAPKMVKKNQKLYIEMLKQKYPQLAALPSKSSLGKNPDSFSYYTAKGLRKIVRGIQKFVPNLKMSSKARLNYLDYATAFRDRQDYRRVLERAFHYLESNDVVPWLDLHKLREDHITDNVDNSNAFLVLIGLALNLEAGSEI